MKVSIEKHAPDSEVQDFVKRARHYIKNNADLKNINKEFLFWYIIYGPFSDLDIELQFRTDKERVKLCCDKSYISVMSTSDSGTEIYFTDSDNQIKSFNQLSKLLNKADKILKKCGVTNIIDSIEKLIK